MGTGMGMIPDPRPGQLLKSGVVVGVDPRPDPRQIGDGDGGGPPIPGKSGIGPGDARGWTPGPDCRRVPSSCTLWVAE